LRAGKADLNSPDTTEAIVMAVGYPSLLIRNGEYEEPKDAVWRSRLNPNRSIIKGVIRCVGRIDLKGHPNRKWAGTSWLVDQDVMITNRHVAVLFAEMRQNRSPQFMQGVQAFIDFNEEIDAREQVEHLIRSIVHIEPMDSKVDLALLRLSPGTTAQLRLTPIPLSTNLGSVSGCRRLSCQRPEEQSARRIRALLRRQIRRQALRARQSDESRLLQ
jgi:endonuclease G